MKLIDLMRVLLGKTDRKRPIGKHSKLLRYYGTIKSGWNLAYLFGKRTSIHGINRLFGETEASYERILWLFIVISSLIGSIYVCCIVSSRFREGKFQTVVDSTRMPVYRVNFPVITLCNMNRLNWNRIDEAKRKFLPNELSSERLELFERVLSTFDGIGFSRFKKFGILEREPLESLNHVNFSEVVNFMTWRCEEFLENCEWRHIKMNCCEIFMRRLTKNGPCWSFNTLETDEGRHRRISDPMWPWRTGGAGPGSGLKVRALIHPEKHYPKSNNEKGLLVMVSEQLVWHREPLRIAANTEARVKIDPEITFFDNDTRIFSSDQRQCLFEDERTSPHFKSLNNFSYMYENCQSECHQEYLMHYCNCTVDLLFPPGPYPPCKVQDLPCLARNNGRFHYTFEPDQEFYERNEPEGMACRCFVSCYSLNYVTDVSTSILSAEKRQNRSYIDVNSYFRFEVMMVYRTSLVFGWLDLVVAFGGIAGLFLGCSLISVIELIYFVCFETPKFLFENVKSKNGQRIHSQSTQTDAQIPITVVNV